MKKYQKLCLGGEIYDTSQPIEEKSKFKMKFRNISNFRSRKTTKKGKRDQNEISKSNDKASKNDSRKNMKSFDDSSKKSVDSCNESKENSIFEGHLNNTKNKKNEKEIE